ncbi:hypothetical protein K1T71_004184 [Dendrolimus kikuchii]|uniref:Uncharacterized protein n=1 Tax=Dendrolimus kikuchii TaxID=765133 RepID=A0ACC1DA92_9NEOP|nr:hypothetical protein K1T71_004184 [Dendrolimus kikuchii]
MLRNILFTSRNSNLQVITMRFAQKKYPKVDKKLQAAAESLASRGFLRPTKPWDPHSRGITFWRISPGFLSCFSVFLALCCHLSVDDLMSFYNTPVDTRTPFEALKKMDLPKNLHIQKDYARFHPDKDTLFNGQSAFPKSSTIVTGLKARKKYEGYTAKRSWP